MQGDGVNDKNSDRHIFRSSSIIRDASAINILIRPARTKAVAAFLGSARIGLIGLITSPMTTAPSIAKLGFGTVGTREIAEAAGTEPMTPTSLLPNAPSPSLNLLPVTQSHENCNHYPKIE